MPVWVSPPCRAVRLRAALGSPLDLAGLSPLEPAFGWQQPSAAQRGPFGGRLGTFGADLTAAAVAEAWHLRCQWCKGVRAGRPLGFFETSPDRQGGGLGDPWNT